MGGWVGGWVGRRRNVPSPVGAGQGFKLDGVGREVARAFHVRAGAQVPPLLPDVVDGDGLGL